MDFMDLADSNGLIENGFAGKDSNGNWLVGYVSANFLNKNFGTLNTATDMKNATSSEGLQLFFDDLVNQGKLKA